MEKPRYGTANLGMAADLSRQRGLSAFNTDTLKCILTLIGAPGLFAFHSLNQFSRAAAS